jgi:hypothetical protein
MLWVTSFVMLQSWSGPQVLLLVVVVGVVVAMQVQGWLKWTLFTSVLLMKGIWEH